MVTVLLVMLITSLVAVNSNNLFNTLNYVSNTSALSVAESGVEYAIYALEQKDDWPAPL